MKILILDSHSNAALACIQSLGRAGHDIYIASDKKNTLSQKSKYVTDVFVYAPPLKQTKTFIEQIIVLQQKHKFQYILPVTDNTLYPLMDITEESLQNVLILPKKGSFEKAFNKEKTLLLAQANNVPVPKNTYVSIDTFDENEFTEFPLFVKPIQSKGNSINGDFTLQPILVDTKIELLENVEKILKYTPLQIQQCVPGIGIGIEVLCHDGEIIRAFAHQRIHEIPLTGGGSSYRKSIPMPDKAYKYSESLMRALKWHGVAMVEFKAFEDSYWLMEINGRFWGSLPLAICAGVDFPKLLIDMLSNTNIPKEYSYNENLYLRNIGKDLDWFKLNLKADKSNPRLITRGIGKSILELSRVLWGRERWDHAYLSDPKLIFAQLKNIFYKEFKTLHHKSIKKLTLRKANRHQRFPSKNIKNILVMCYGNICRSPLVEILLNEYLVKEGYKIVSAGFHKKENRTSPENYMKTCLEYDIDLTSHRSKKINDELASWADLILIMDYGNMLLMKKQFDSTVINKCRFLGTYNPEKIVVEISDPYKSKKATSIKIIQQMKNSCDGLIKKLRNIK